MTSVDALTRYRIQQLMQLIEETGIIDAMPYELMLKVLDHIEVGADGRVDAIFLEGGIRITNLNSK